MSSALTPLVLAASTTAPTPSGELPKINSAAATAPATSTLGSFNMSCHCSCGVLGVIGPVASGIKGRVPSGLRGALGSGIVPTPVPKLSLPLTPVPVTPPVVPPAAAAAAAAFAALASSY